MQILRTGAHSDRCSHIVADVLGPHRVSYANVGVVVVTGFVVRQLTWRFFQFPGGGALEGGCVQLRLRVYSCSGDCMTR